MGPAEPGGRGFGGLKLSLSADQLRNSLRQKSEPVENRLSRDEILERNLLTDYVTRSGASLKRSGQHLITNRCPITTHKESHFCVSIEPGKQLWNCHDCGRGGSIIEWIMEETGRPAAEVLREFQDRSVQVNRKPEIVATYDYTDPSGKLLFQVVRYQPKTFKQRQPDGAGGWKWGLDGITRVLYNLPQILAGQRVLVVEGEKDAQSASKLGYAATCNAGGASAWLNAYADSLKGKDVIIIPDNDPVGEKHADAVLTSLDRKANSVKIVRVPVPYKDLSDWINSFVVSDAAKKAVEDLIALTPHILAPPPIYSITELEQQYREFVRRIESTSFDLGNFLPKLGAKVRKLVPGELVLVMGDTGQGKTAVMQCIARAASPLPTLFFELELPASMMFERFIQMESGCFAHDVERDCREEDNLIASRFSGLQHILVCPESGITPTQVEIYIGKSELKFGVPPVVVCVDYIGLLKHANARSRYEAISDSAEQMKIIAKRTGTIIILGSQVSRPMDKKKDSGEVRLHDAKDSGSLENSAGLVLGCWRPAPNELNIKILKNTRGYPGDVIECDFDGAKMQIKESADL